VSCRPFSQPEREWPRRGPLGQEDGPTEESRLGSRHQSGGRVSDSGLTRVFGVVDRGWQQACRHGGRVVEGKAEQLAPSPERRSIVEGVIEGSERVLAAATEAASVTPRRAGRTGWTGSHGGKGGKAE